MLLPLRISTLPVKPGAGTKRSCGMVQVPLPLVLVGRLSKKSDHNIRPYTWRKAAPQP